MLLISGGTVYDPVYEVAGVVQDVWIDNGRIVAAPGDPAVRPVRTIDARGLVVMPGGIDMHCHIAGPKVNAARKMLPEDRRRAPPLHRTDVLRSGTAGSVPSTFATGYLYAGMGYTTAIDAAIPPLAARHVHEEFHDTPLLDKGFLTLVGNNHFVLEQIQSGDRQLLRNFLAWLLGAVRGYGVKLVNPGGVESWKAGGRNVSSVDDEVPGFRLRVRDIIREVALAADELALPHAVHIHGNNLGLPGNWQTTLDTMHALEGQRGHLTHIQFHSYAGEASDQATFGSAVPQLVEYVNAHSNITIDVGQVLFGSTISMTGDGPLGYFLHRVTGNKWFGCDLELESGCGIVPIQYREKSFVHALQWAVGLEWFLLMQDPWRIALTTDHPNGASFLAYPQIIALLMDRSRRNEVLARLPERMQARTALADLDREYTLNEIAIVTRAAPARILELKNKGHLGVAADADVVVYAPQADIQRMFEAPRYVIKGGEVVVEDGELRAAPQGQTIYSAPEFDAEAVPAIRDWFEDRYTLRFENYAVGENL